jgi:hypothetical protein
MDIVAVDAVGKTWVYLLAFWHGRPVHGIKRLESSLQKDRNIFAKR